MEGMGIWGYYHYSSKGVCWVRGCVGLGGVLG